MRIWRSLDRAAVVAAALLCELFGGDRIANGLSYAVSKQTAQGNFFEAPNFFCPPKKTHQKGGQDGLASSGMR